MHKFTNQTLNVDRLECLVGISPILSVLELGQAKESKSVWKTDCLNFCWLIYKSVPSFCQIVIEGEHLGYEIFNTILVWKTVASIKKYKYFICLFHWTIDV